MTVPSDTDRPAPGEIIERPVFPLQAVLFPGATLPLRIFEIRYVDMVRACLRSDAGFVVARITDGQEVGEAAAHETVGTLAAITHWDMAPGGLLHILIEGRQRVRLSGRRVDHGLIRARAECLPEEIDQALPERYQICGQIARHIAEEMFDTEAVARPAGAAEAAAPTEGDPAALAGRVLPAPWRFDSATWVGRRLSEWLPLDGPERQALLELDDPVARLERLWPALVSQGWVRTAAGPPTVS